jgi:hypothetical protein
MLPRIGASKVVSTWLLVLLAASLIAMVDGGWLASWTSLAPRRIWSGEVWRLVTWVLVEREPGMLLVTGFCIYRFAGELAPRWGERRLRRFALHIVLAAAVLTTLAALVAIDAARARSGGWVVPVAFIIAWARQFPTASLQLYGGVVLGGQRLVLAILLVQIVYAAAAGLFSRIPELVACFGAAYYPRAWLTP